MNKDYYTYEYYTQGSKVIHYFIHVTDLADAKVFSVDKTPDGKKKS